MRRGGRILIIIGVLLGLLAAVAAVFILQQKPEQPVVPTVLTPIVPTKQVVVAVQDIPQGSAITPDALRLEEHPEDTLPPGAVTTLEETQGKVTAVQIFRGQVLLSKMLTTEEQVRLLGGYAAALVPQGKVAVVLPVNRLTSVAYAIKPGDRVDIMISLRFFDVDQATQIREPVVTTGGAAGQEQEQITGTQLPRHVVQLTLQDVEVIRVGNWPIGEAKPGAAEEKVAEATPTATPPPAGGEAAPTPTPPPAPDVVTLVLPQQDALVLKYAKENDLGIELALRGTNDHNLVSTEAVTLDYMLARFNVSNPPKRPYQVEPTEIKDTAVPAAPTPK
jgi:pilus assembly protein CpaB